MKLIYMHIYIERVFFRVIQAARIETTKCNKVALRDSASHNKAIAYGLFKIVPNGRVRPYIIFNRVVFLLLYIFVNETELCNVIAEKEC